MTQGGGQKKARFLRLRFAVGKRFLSEPPVYRVVNRFSLSMRDGGEYDGAMTLRSAKLLAWLILAFILFATVAPIGLRPHTVTSVDLDRAGAYLLAGLVFALAYPKQWKTVAALLVLGALAIEYLQYLSPTRHPRLHDGAVKALGASLGLISGWAINRRREPKAEAAVATPLANAEDQGKGFV
jgi:peptidoglycan/LPS O-acetylase OafA/YrhL